MEKLLVPASVIGAGSRTGVVGGLVAPKGRMEGRLFHNSQTLLCSIISYYDTCTPYYVT